MKTKMLVMFLLVTIILVSCAPATANTSTEVPFPLTIIFAPTFAPVMKTPTLQVTLSVTPIPAQTAELEKWMKYERALALEILWKSDAICEWEILGQSNQEVYVWSLCQITNLEIGSAASVPAVIHLGNDGSIEKVQIPGDGTQYGIDIRKMFPSELQEQIITQSVSIDEMWSHIQSRHKNPEPPLIVLSGVSLP